MLDIYVFRDNCIRNVTDIVITNCDGNLANIF